MIKLGTRNSPLALAQATMVKQHLISLFPNLTISIIPIMTQGDIDKHQPLAAIGGKGVFIKSLEQALIAGTIDIAVHSLKDVTAHIDERTCLAAFLSPESRTDCFVFSDGSTYSSLEALPTGMSCATSSLRRKALLNYLRPDILVKDIRGNVDTRLSKCSSGYADAVILSSVGLIRLNKQHLIGYECNPEQFIPAPGQGVITIQALHSNSKLMSYLNALNKTLIQQQCLLEQRLVHAVGLDCNYPLGVYAVVNDGNVTVRVCWSQTDCTDYQEHLIQGTYKSVEHSIDQLAEIIKDTIKG